MSISHGGYTFQSLTTHAIPVEDLWEYEAIDASFYGVAGAVEITDAEHGRTIGVECRFQSYSTPALLLAALNTVDSKKGVLKDATLTLVVAASSMVYPHCSFRGFQRSGPMFYDGSGVNGWIQSGVLLFRQLKRTA